MTERMIDVGGVRLCTETFGDPDDPAVLLIMGMAGSMLWWDERFCRALADGGRHVLRYDHRDTGRSQSWPPGRPGYTGDDLVADVARVLDGHGIAAAHVVGVSMGGALAQVFALDRPDRVLSLVLMSTSPGGPGDGLPGPAPEYLEFLSGDASVSAGESDPRAGIERVVAEVRVLAGAARPFDEAAARALVERDAARADSYASASNHAEVEGGGPWRHRLGDIAVPTLVVHGTADPLFPVAHGVALAAEIPGARLLQLEGAGHGLDPADHDVVAGAILAHTAEV
jgi:pimeloyl-ACP methyl ester carboxylesterase